MKNFPEKIRKIIVTKRCRFATAGLLAPALFAALFISGFSPVLAAGLVVAPAVIDGHGLPRDILNYRLTVTNTDGGPKNIFASVYELTASGAQQFADPSTSNRPALLADWIGVSRGSMLFAPGETKTIPVSININPYAAEGDYHAVIAFVKGSTRDEAESHLNGAPQALVNISVASDAKEALQVDNFSPVKRFSSGFPVEFAYIIENVGTVPAVPSGLVLFYDRTGHEIGSIDANPGAAAVAPGEKRNFTATWADGGGFGQYKSVLQLSYGASGATLESVALFWILPWQKLLLVFLGLLVLAVVLAVVLHKQYVKRHHNRMRAIEKIMKDRRVVDLRKKT